MAYLTKRDKLAAEAEWLACWRRAGCHTVQRACNGKDAASSVGLFRLEVVGTVKQTFGNATKLRVWMGDINMTRLLTRLRHFRLIRDETINVRSGSGRICDEALVARAVMDTHAEAAISHQDVDAYLATGLPLPPAMEEKLLDARLAEAPMSSNGPPAL